MRNFLLVLTFFALASCNERRAKVQNSDDFYTNKGGADLGRIPLVKPYEAVVPATGNKNWLVHSIDSMLVTIPGVKGMNVLEHKLILLYSVNTVIDFKHAKEGWFAIIPASHTFMSFLSHNDYVSWLSSHGIKKEPFLYKPNTVFHYFNRLNIIDWNRLPRAFNCGT